MYWSILLLPIPMVKRVVGIVLWLLVRTTYFPSGTSLLGLISLRVPLYGYTNMPTNKLDMIGIQHIIAGCRDEMLPGVMLCRDPLRIESPLA